MEGLSYCNLYRSKFGDQKWVLLGLLGPPGLSIQCRSSKAHQTALATVRSGHLHSMTFVQWVKSCFTCPCSLLAPPAHLLDCWGISLRQLYEEQGLVCETIMRNGQMDLV
ncbi:uncharacterized protein TNCV_4335081 [Trichonephila clavipes]|uniref:Uncharacterized protein n=1 Tax=Trichonephila clavipes TaxID=2585209 RepID=A0A8X6RE38_TRICX|nr:uncharacterized protein TNCV_4335081 [Trichonephila clavipes]